MCSVTSKSLYSLCACAQGPITLLRGVENEYQNPVVSWVSDLQWPKQALCSWWCLQGQSSKNFLGLYVSDAGGRQPFALYNSCSTRRHSQRTSSFLRWIVIQNVGKHCKYCAARLQTLFPLDGVLLSWTKKAHQSLCLNHSLKAKKIRSMI